MLALAALLLIGPHLLLTDDINLDGKPDKVYWQSHPHPCVDVSMLDAPPTSDVDIYVKSEGKMILAGTFEESSSFTAFWVRQTQTNLRILAFAFTKNGIKHYFGLSRRFRLFAIDERLFA